MFQASFELEALQDFQSAINYYKKISPRLADELHADFWEKINYIKKYPEHFPIRHQNVRIARTNSYPYAIHFQFEQDKIRILRVLHHKQYYASDS